MSNCRPCVQGAREQQLGAGCEGKTDWEISVGIAEATMRFHVDSPGAVHRAKTVARLVNRQLIQARITLQKRPLWKRPFVFSIR
jgi:hypothetical protein